MHKMQSLVETVTLDSTVRSSEWRTIMMEEQITFEFEKRPTIKGFPELKWTGKRPYLSTQYFPAQLRESYEIGRAHV